MKKTKNAKTNCNSYNRRTRKRGRPHKKLRDMVDEDLKQACNGQRPSGMQKDYIGSQGPQWTVALEGWR